MADWDFMVPGVKQTVEVLALEENERLKFRFLGGNTVEISFADRTPQSTRVTVLESGFTGPDPEAKVAIAVEGFAIVLCDLKSLLETGASGGMVRDKAQLIADDRAKAA